jgi:hypothetical protein
MYVDIITLTSVLSLPTPRLRQAGHKWRGSKPLKVKLNTERVCFLTFPPTGGRELKGGGIIE